MFAGIVLLLLFEHARWYDYLAVLVGALIVGFLILFALMGLTYTFDRQLWRYLFGGEYEERRESWARDVAEQRDKRGSQEPEPPV